MCNMTKEEFVKRFMADQCERRKKKDTAFRLYLAESRWRMKRRYRSNLIRPSK